MLTYVHLGPIHISRISAQIFVILNVDRCASRWKYKERKCRGLRLKTQNVNQASVFPPFIASTRKGRFFITFLWRFLQTMKIKTKSKMTPRAKMMTGKLDTSFTIIRSVLIWLADSSSIVAV